MNMVSLRTYGKHEQPGGSIRGGVVAALDVGTSKISCFIARVDPSRGRLPGGIQIMGIGHQVSRGIRGGAIVDMESADEAIRAAVETAERMAGITIDSVVVNVSAGDPRSETFGVQMSLAGGEVGESDISRLLSEGQKHCQPADSLVLHTIPVGYAIDGNRGIRDPRGMFGERLGVEMHVVSAGTGPLRNLMLCVERCHLDVSGTVVSPYASGLACLVDDEMELGVTCIDFGSGVTSIAAFFENSPIYVGSVPVGGGHITNDIARGLSTPLSHAERMKTLYGSALASPTDEREMIDVPQVGEEDEEYANHLPRSVLTGIIRPRVEEILELVRDKLASSGVGAIAGRRIVITGGGSQLTGVRELAAQILGNSVRIGRPIGVSGLAQAAGGPAFAASVGLLRYVQLRPAEITGAAGGQPMIAGGPGQLARIGRWLKENF